MADDELHGESDPAGSAGPSESQLFDSLQGDVVTNEQLQNWHLLNSQIDDLVLDPCSQEGDIDLALLISPANLTNEVELYPSSAAEDVVASLSSTSASPVASTSRPLCGSNATTKYLNGELSFAQFSEIMEKIHNEEKGGSPTKRARTQAHSSDSDDGVVSDDELKDVIWTPHLKSSKKGKPKAPRRRKHDVPRHLVGLMGEANMQYAHGQNDQAMKMCHEIIRMAPMSSEPFRMLSMIYDESGDSNKSLQYSLIAAHLQPDDAEEWVRLAQVSLEMGEPKQALACYSKASKYDNTNLLLVLEKCHLLESLGQSKKALETYLQVLKCLPGDDASGYFILARKLCKTYHENGSLGKAIEALSLAFTKHPEEVTAEDVNHLVELHMTNKAYFPALMISRSSKCRSYIITMLQYDGFSEWDRNDDNLPVVYPVLIKNCAIVMYNADGEKLSIQSECKFTSLHKTITRCEVSELIPIDLRVKLIISLLHLSVQAPINELVGPLLEEDWEENGDLHLDLAEVYMEVGLYTEARPILHRLVTDTRTYGEAAVWLRYAECLNAVGEVASSMAAYEKVVALAPGHVSARVALSALQQQLGKPEDAIKTLSTDPDHTTDVSESDVCLLMHKCQVLWGQGRWAEYLATSKQVIVSHIDVRHQKLLKDVSATHCVSNKRKAMKDEDLTLTSASKSFANMRGVGKIELYDLYNKATGMLIQHKRYPELLEFALCSMTNPAFVTDSAIINRMDEMAMNACLLSRDSVYGYRYIRNLILKDPESTQAWNLFAQMLQYSTDSRHHRFCLRLMTKHPKNVYLNILNAHIATISGSYKLALGEYCEAYRQCPDDPLVCLCMGLMFLHMTLQKYSSKRHWTVAQSMAFLSKYVEQRGDCQEVCYNMGRAMHQLGLLHVATYYYKKALDHGPAIPSEPAVFDMTHQVAYNLALIYRNSGCREQAHILMQKYCVV